MPTAQTLTRPVNSLVDELDSLISQMNDEERRYLKYVYSKIKEAEEKFVQVSDVYRNVEAELTANQNALDIWLDYIQRKYQELSTHEYQTGSNQTDDQQEHSTPFGDSADYQADSTAD